MGFGFNLFFMFIIVPLTGIVLLAWIVTGKSFFGKIIGLIFLAIFSLVLLVSTIHFFRSKTELSKDDYYGEYVVNRNYFAGKQADWQYENFRFEIKENDSIYFYVTNREKVLKTYRGTISTTDPNLYRSVILKINMEQPTHHILASNPTIYRNSWDFNLVFLSPKFNNVYFTKGTWEPIEK